MLRRIRYLLLVLLAGGVLFGLVEAASAASEGVWEGRPGVRGEITAIDGITLTVVAARGEVVVVTDEHTLFRVIGDEDPALDDLAVGDTVLTRGMRQEDGSMLAAFVARQPAGDVAGGRVTAVTDDSLTLASRDGETVTVTVNPDTIVALPRRDLTWDEGDPSGQDVVREGMPLLAFGPATGDGLEAHTLIPRRRGHRPPRPGVTGEITGIDGDTFTVSTPHDVELAVVTDADTRFRVPGVEEPDLTDFAVGDAVVVRGHRTEDGDVLARMVVIRPPGRGAIGTITSIDGTEFFLMNRTGLRLTVATTEETNFRVGTNGGATLDEFAPGDRVFVFGEMGDDDATLLATHVAKRAR